MQLLRALFVLGAIAYVVGLVLQERKRLAVVERLPGSEARDYHERARRRAERGMIALAGVCAAAGAAAAVYLAGGFNGGG